MMPAPIRGSDIHVSEDIRRMLRALAATHEAAHQVAGAQGDYAAGYSAGFFDGLRAIAEASGGQVREGTEQTIRELYKLLSSYF